MKEVSAKEVKITMNNGCSLSFIPTTKTIRTIARCDLWPFGVDVLSIKGLYKIHHRLVRTMKNIEDIGIEISYQRVAKDISHLTAAVVLLEKKHPSKDVNNLMALVQENSHQYHNAFKDVYKGLPLSVRLRSYKHCKLCNPNHSINVSGSFYFNGDIPF